MQSMEYTPRTRRWQAPTRVKVADVIAAIVAVGLVIWSALYVVPAIFGGVDRGSLVTAVGWAFIPLALTLVFVWLIDSWEREPRWLYALALGWGAAISVLGAIFMNGLVAEAAASAAGSDATNEEINRIVVSYGAPIIEEFFKGVGVLIIFFVFRRYFNGPVDGIVYGALIGAGFAFTENIQYFAVYADDIENVFRLRFIDGPLSHDAYTAFFGFFIGFAEYSKSKRAVYAWMIPAMIGAMFFHWTNNAGIYWGLDYNTYKLINNVPVAILVLAMVIYALRDERRVVESGLTYYVDKGLISPTEVQIVMTLRERRRALRWAESRAIAKGWESGSGREAMEVLQEELLALGHDRTRAVRTDQQAKKSFLRQEAERFSAINTSRGVFL